MTTLQPVPLQPTWHTQCQPFWSRVHRPFPKQSPGQPSEKTAESNNHGDIRMALANNAASPYREAANHLCSIQMRWWINGIGAHLLTQTSQGTCYPSLPPCFALGSQLSIINASPNSQPLGQTRGKLWWGQKMFSVSFWKMYLLISIKTGWMIPYVVMAKTLGKGSRF